MPSPLKKALACLLFPLALLAQTSLKATNAGPRAWSFWVTGPLPLGSAPEPTVQDWARPGYKPPSLLTVPPRSSCQWTWDDRALASQHLVLALLDDTPDDTAELSACNPHGVMLIHRRGAAAKPWVMSIRTPGSPLTRAQLESRICRLDGSHLSIHGTSYPAASVLQAAAAGSSSAGVEPKAEATGAGAAAAEPLPISLQSLIQPSTARDRELSPTSPSLASLLALSPASQTSSGPDGIGGGPLMASSPVSEPVSAGDGSRKRKREGSDDKNSPSAKRPRSAPAALGTADAHTTLEIWNQGDGPWTFIPILAMGVMVVHRTELPPGEVNPTYVDPEENQPVLFPSGCRATLRPADGTARLALTFHAKEAGAGRGGAEIPFDWDVVASGSSDQTVPQVRCLLATCPASVEVKPPRTLILKQGTGVLPSMGAGFFHIHGKSAPMDGGAWD